ncbi:MAG: polyribonucleotide nucleotidyltransferase [Candidatus Levybacteria bacterium RBG_16_35_11]|nr:MAG: polyribonucleotide nucleotidyltransferase [Candidatus Levybacteria bacterium RBG_16_35_11]
MKKSSVELELAGKKINFQTGDLAKQATSSILARMGDTMVLVTVVMGNLREDIDYFPLSVEYIERLYAGGRIKGSRWVKREGRPSDEAILTGRLIDRSIRPFFPKEFKREVQVVVTVLSVDGENEPDILSINAVSAALAISNIPWNGPIGAVRVGYVKEKDNGKKEFIINPEHAELEFSELDLIASQTTDKTIMIEAGALEVTNEILLEGIEKAHAETAKIIEFIEKFAKEQGIKKESYVEDPKLSEAVLLIEKNYKTEVVNLVENRLKNESGKLDEDLIEMVYEQSAAQNPDFAVDKKTIAKAIEKVLYKEIRKQIVKTGKRPDGRKIDEVREIGVSVSILPRTHGSGLFSRGQTQALTVATLGSPKLEQLIESAEGEETKKYIHHYSMPPYSVGEAGRIGTPSRREIGHGALAERALIPVIPSQDVFPYTIRVVTEVLSSNGSTSMAATCGSTLALMDAGVPIKKPVAGVAMGLMIDGEKYEILTDILGLEDFSGFMDFKVAGTTDGITAIQLDVKNDGLTVNQVKDTIEKAKTARLYILDKMLSVISKSREEISAYAPKIELLHIPVEKIGEVIGPGGKIIKNIIAQTGATVDVEDDGSVAISGTDEGSVKKASDWVKALTREITPGESFEGEVKRILPFGAFVEILPGKEGMVHVSKMSSEFVKDPSEIVEIGQKVKVRVIEIDEQGRINLSMLFGTEQRSEGGRPRLEGQERRGGFYERRPERSPEPYGTGRSEHPLSKQLRRERGMTDWRQKNISRARTQSQSRFTRKPR